MNRKLIFASLILLCANFVGAQTTVFQLGDLFYRITSENSVAVATNIDLLNQVNNYYGELVSVDIPQSVDYEGVTYSVTTIEPFAFAGCGNLVYVGIPSSITTIPMYAFAQSAISGIDIPESVTTIEADAFARCINLTGLRLPSALTAISEECFAQSGLVSVIIPEGVETIGKNAFAECADLMEVQIPSSVTSIGDYAFYSCSSLSVMVLMPTVPPSANRNILNNTGNFPIVVPAGCLTAYHTTPWRNFHRVEMGAVMIEVTYSDDPSHSVTFFSQEGKEATIVIAEVGKNVSYILFNDRIILRDELQMATTPVEGLGDVPICLFTTPKLIGGNLIEDEFAQQLLSKKARVHIVYGEPVKVETNPAAGEVLGIAPADIDRTGCITVRYPGKEIKEVDYTLITIAQGDESGIVLPDIEAGEEVTTARRKASRILEVYNVEQTIVPDQGNDSFSFHPVRRYSENDIDITFTTLFPGYCYTVKLAEGAVTFADDSKSSAYSWEFKMAIGTSVDEITVAGELAFNGYEVVAVDAQAVINIYDLSGVLVASGKGRVDVSALRGGIYIARSENEVLKIAL